MVFEPFGLELVMVFEGTKGEYGHSYRFNAQMNMKEKEIFAFEMHLMKFFVCALNNYDIISA